MERISSKENRRILDARRVREGRDAARLFVEGKRLCSEAVTSRLAIETAFVSDDFNDEALLSEITGAADATFRISNRLAAWLSETTTTQGVFLIAEVPANGRVQIERRLDGETDSLTVLLNGVNNPANLGAVLRTAEAAGVSGVVATAGSAAAFSPKALRASMGSAFRMPIWAAPEFSEAIDWARSMGMRCVGTSGAAPKSYLEVSWGGPTMLVLGSEAHGLDSAETKRLDEVVTIPLSSNVESLNLAVAAGVLLFEARRQKGLT